MVQRAQRTGKKAEGEAEGGLFYDEAGSLGAPDSRMDIVSFPFLSHAHFLCFVFTIGLFLALAVLFFFLFLRLSLSLSFPLFPVSAVICFIKFSSFYSWNLFVRSVHFEHGIDSLKKRWRRASGERRTARNQGTDIKLGNSPEPRVFVLDGLWGVGEFVQLLRCSLYFFPLFSPCLSNTFFFF